MTIGKGILLLAGACLSVSAAVANDKNPGNDAAIADLSRLAGETSPAARQELSELNNIAGKLRTSESPSRLKTSKSGLSPEHSRAMLGKFRINGI